MAISFVAKGTFASGTGTVAPGIPSGMQDGDLMILVIHSVNEAITGPTGWTAAPAFPNHSGTAERGTGAAAGGVQVRCFARWWQSGDSAPTVADTGNMTAAIIIGVRGVDPTDPFDSATPVGMNAAASSTLTLTGITTNSANAMVVHATALDFDSSTITVGTLTNGNLTSLTAQHTQVVTTGQGGGLYIVTGFKASAGASGNTTTGAGSSTAIASICFALKPYVEPAVDYIADGWTHRCPIVIQQSVITGSGALTDMPVLLTHACIPNDFLDSDLFQSDGGDIRFSSDEDGQVGLAVEVVSFAGHATPGSATAEIWVKVPSVSHNTDTTIYMWRKTGSGVTQEAVTHSKGRNAVWSGNGIKRVYHGNGTTDSTGNGGTLTPAGNATYTTTNAKIGSAFSLDGTGDWFTGDSGADIDNLSALSVVAWVRPASLSTIGNAKVIAGKGASANGFTFYERYDTAGGFLSTWRAQDEETSTTAVLAANTWARATFTATGTSIAAVLVYVNGSAISTNAEDNAGSVSDASDSFTIGSASGQWTGDPWNGLIDEVWLVSGAFSADLEQALYANQNNPGAFAIEGTITDLSGSSEHDLTATGVNAGAPVLAKPALVQIQALIATGVTAGPQLGRPALTQKHGLAATAIDLSAPVLAAPNLVVAVNFAATAVVLGAPVLPSPAFGQKHALTATGLVATPVLAAPALTVVVHFEADGLDIGEPVLAAPALTQAAPVIATGLNFGAPVLGRPAFGQIHALVATGILASPRVGAPALTVVVNFLADALVTGAPVLAKPAVAQANALAASGLTLTPRLDRPTLAQAQALAATGLTTTPRVGAPAITQAQALTATGLIATPSLDRPGIAQAQALAAIGLVATPIIARPAMAQVHALVAAGLRFGGAVLDAPALSQSQALAAAGIYFTAPVLDRPVLDTNDPAQPTTERVATVAIDARAVAAALAERAAQVVMEARTAAVELSGPRVATVVLAPRVATVEIEERAA